MSIRSIAIIRAELADQIAVVDTFDHDECHIGNDLYRISSTRATRLADELHLAEMADRYGHQG